MEGKEKTQQSQHAPSWYNLKWIEREVKFDTKTNLNSRGSLCEQLMLYFVSHISTTDITVDVADRSSVKEDIMSQSEYESSASESL